MALSGMVFVLTGKSSLTRPVLMQKIKDNGGSYATTFTKKVTHVLCGAEFEETEKYLKSKKTEGVHAVSEPFIDACIKAHKGSKPNPSETEFDPENVSEKGQEEEKSDDPHSDEEKSEHSNSENADLVSDVSAPKEKPKSKGPRTVRAHKEATTTALKNWVVFVSGSKNELKDLIEVNGGTVTSSKNPKNLSQITHILDGASGKAVEEMKGFGAVVIDEGFIRETIDSFKSPKILVPSSPGPKKKKGAPVVEKVISRRPFKGETCYVVQYVGLEDDQNELLSYDDVIARGGEKALKKFEVHWKKEMSVFQFSNKTSKLETIKAKDSPKKSPKKPKAQATKETTPKKKTKEATPEPNPKKTKTPTPKKGSEAKPSTKAKATKKTTPKKADEVPKEKTPKRKATKEPVSEPSPKKAKTTPKKTKTTTPKKGTPKRKEGPTKKASSRPTKRQRT